LLSLKISKIPLRIRTSSHSLPLNRKKMQSQNWRMTSEMPMNCHKHLSQSLSMKNSKLKILPKYLSLRKFCPSLIWKTTPKYILEVPRLFESLPIRRWSLNSLENNFLGLSSREFMMLQQTDGIPLTSIVNATRRDGR
jgi:hypothetical protein